MSAKQVDQECLSFVCFLDMLISPTRGSTHGGHYHAYIRDIDGLGKWTHPVRKDSANICRTNVFCFLGIWGKLIFAAAISDFTTTEELIHCLKLEMSFFMKGTTTSFVIL